MNSELEPKGYVAPPRGKTTYNWERLKGEFFASEFLTVSEFFTDRFGKCTQKMQTRATGWAKEKRKLEEKAVKRALEKRMLEKQKQYEEAIDYLVDEHVVKTLKKKIKKKGKKEEELLSIQAKALKVYWHILRTQAGMPTNITKNDNTTTIKEPDLDQEGRDRLKAWNPEANL